MANGIKTFKIVINGLTESISAVDALNKQLDSLEQRINKINSIKITATGGSGTSSRGSSGVLSDEAKLEKQIEQIEAKREVYSKEIYQNYLASKDQLNETLKDQKNLAAQERLRARTYSNTIRGLKEELSDIKETMQTIDLGDSAGLEKMAARADEINRKLNEIDESYGQFGRNVGNYKSVADGFKKLEIQVNGVTRSFNNAREAYRTLKNERDTMALSGERETKQFKEIDETVKTLASDISDMNKSSAFMDNVLDTMQSFSAFAGIGVGLSQLFGFDDEVFSDSMKKLTSLLLIVKSFETLASQWKANEGIMGKLFKPISEKLDNWAEKKGENAVKKYIEGLIKGAGKDKDDLKEALSKIGTEHEDSLISDMLVSKELNGEFSTVEEYKKAFDGLKETFAGLTKEEKAALYVTEMLNVRIETFGGRTKKVFGVVTGLVKGLSRVLLTLGGVFATLLASELLDKLVDFAKGLNTAKITADAAAESINALTKSFEQQRDALGASYLKGEISDMEYLNSLYEKQSALLAREVEQLKELSKANKYNGLFGSRVMSDRNTQFNGKKFEPTTVGAGSLSLPNWIGFSVNDLEVTVKSIEDVEAAWKKCQETIKNGKDLADDGGGIFSRNYWISLVATVKDTEKVMIGMGNIKLSDFVNQFGELNRQLKNTEITTDEYAKEVGKLKKEMNDNKVLNSVIANLDKYIPDEKVREAVQNIINEISRLDDAFNMTSAEQVHHWRQIEIDSMEDGLEKAKAQIEENRRWQIQQEGKTAKQKELINKKYNREIQNAEEKHRQEQIEKAKAHADKLKNVDDWLAKLRIENMKKGWKKREAEINLEWEQELRKAYEGRIKVKELEEEINKKYDTKIKEERIKWASDMLRIYQDLAQNIQQINKTTFDTEASTASRNVQNKSAKRQQEVGYSMLTPNSYDDIKNLEEYYKKILDIKKNEADKEAAIERERLEKELEYAKEEEKLRHERAIDASSGEYATQLKEGLITKEQYDELIEKENLAHNARMNAIDKEYLSNLDNVTKEELENTQQLYNDYYSKIISDLSKKRSEIDSITSKQPVMDKQGWDVVNIAKTSSNYKTALKEYDGLKNDIIRKQRELEEALRAKSISPEDFAMREADIKKEMEAIDNAVKGVKQRQKMLIADFIQSIEKYLQEGIQAFQDIMQAVWDAQDNNFDKQQEYLDKLNDELDKKLTEQQDIVQKHKDAINDIEDELATSRGDRRQHLIDQLNAEMAAQRAAQQQEKKIQKEKEAAEKKAEALEKKRRKAQYHRDMIQAVVNGALAVTRAADNSWPIPAVPMMALAAATTAAQIAIMASNKPYAKGGLLEGPSHKQGGIPIPGTGIEVEGKEYVVRKKSTGPNIDLLDYINKSERRLSLSDFIDFYSGDKPKKAIRSVRNKFEDGGYMPALPNALDVRDQLQNVIINQDNRPIVVSVVDINNKQAQVRKVKTLAGLGSE